MAGGTERYDTGQGDAAGAELASALADAVDAAALPALGGGGGAGYGRFVAAYDDYRAAIADRVGEQARVGGLVQAMMDGVHRRLGQPPVQRVAMPSGVR